MEGLILCQRYREAAAECEGLLEGVDRLYLQAEVAWRQGDLEVRPAPQGRQPGSCELTLVGWWASVYAAKFSGAVLACGMW